MIDSDKFNLEKMWQLTLLMTGATIIVAYLTRKMTALGVKTIRTWSKEPLAKIHKENGTPRVLISLLWIVIFFNHFLYLATLWGIAVAWQFGYINLP